MIGSIIGDIAGSVYEFHNEKDMTNIVLYGPQHHFTDDSVMTIATADWILHGGEVAEYYVKHGLKHPGAGYGGAFNSWLHSFQDGIIPPAYNSFGNGSAMRVSPVAWAFETESEVLDKAAETAACTHNHPDGIAGAQAIALAIFMARKGKSKDEIKAAIDKDFYQLDFTCDEIRPTYDWHSERFGLGVSCKGSVPPAIRAFLDSHSFEDCIRIAISLGGDSDTIGCMAGGIAEAYYGITEKQRCLAMKCLDDEQQAVVDEFEKKFGQKLILA